MNIAIKSLNSLHLLEPSPLSSIPFHKVEHLRQFFDLIFFIFNNKWKNKKKNTPSCKNQFIIYSSESKIEMSNKWCGYNVTNVR